MAHDYHPRSGELTDPASVSPVFFDGCAECERKAEDPLLWGGLLPVAVWAKMLQVEFGDESYRSAAEAKAGRVAYHQAIFLERNMGLPAQLVFGIMRSKAGLPEVSDGGVLDVEGV